VQIRPNVRVTNEEENEGPLIHAPNNLVVTTNLPHHVTLSFHIVTSNSAKIACAARETAQEVLRISKRTGCSDINLFLDPESWHKLLGTPGEAVAKAKPWFKIYAIATGKLNCPVDLLSRAVILIPLAVK
jgi:hypothetical protein